MMYALFLNGLLSLGGFFVVNSLIPRFKDAFTSAGLFGMDLCKKDKPKIPEAMGMISGSVLLVILFLYIPVPFNSHFIALDSKFPYQEFVELLAALLSICTMVFLGFADDVLNLPWRHKLLLPTLASLPLLMVYYANGGSTMVVVPQPLRKCLGLSVDLGFLYYVYMGMLAVFCTNAINILSGINGLESGQSLVIGTSILIYSLMEWASDPRAHRFSASLIIPYLFTSLALFKYNRFPARAFVGDTFCYYSGMLFAVVGILGHFSKTMMLFFIPQVFNFLLSVPQLFHFIPCPRHRLPRYIPEKNTLSPSVFKVRKSQLNSIGKLILWILGKLKYLRIGWIEEKNKDEVLCTNLTLVNLVLRLMGNTHESTLCVVLLSIQVLCSVLAFFIRYPLAHLFYDV